ncbi:MAG: hypothetical protein ACHQ2Z_00260 [Elusimicrobiota bacterium]
MTHPKPSLRAPLLAPLRAAIVPVLSIFSCWAVFLALLHRVTASIGIFVAEECTGTMAYRWLHQIPAVPPGIAFPLRLFGEDIPVMYSLYHGPWIVYFVAPFVAWGGCTLAVLRSYNACVFLVAIAGTYQLAKALYRSDAVAFLCALMISVCPSLVLFGAEWVHSAMAASAWTLYFGLMFARTRRPLFAYLCSAALVGGVCTASWYAGLAVGLLLCLVLMPRRVLALLPEERRQRRTLVGGCLLCAGFFLLPILAYNAANGWATLRFLMGHALHRRLPTAFWYLGTGSNLDYRHNLKISLEQLAMLCDGDAIMVVARKPWHLVYAVPLLFSLARTAREVWNRRTLWLKSAVLWTTAIGYVLISPISPTMQLAIHLTPLAPILVVLLFSGYDAVRAPRVRGLFLAAAAALCAAQFAGDLKLLERANVDVTRAGSYESSQLMIEVCRWAAARPRTPVVPLSFALFHALQFYTESRARIVPLPSVTLEAVPWDKWARRRDKPYFIAENDDGGARSWTALKAAAERGGIELTRVKTFTDGSGHPGFEVYVAK